MLNLTLIVILNYHFVYKNLIIKTKKIVPNETSEILLVLFFINYFKGLALDLYSYSITKNTKNQGLSLKYAKFHTKGEFSYVKKETPEEETEVHYIKT